MTHCRGPTGTYETFVLASLRRRVSLSAMQETEPQCGDLQLAFADGSAGGLSG